MASKKIYINARFLLSYPSGVERYAYQMCKAIVGEGVDVTLICPKNGKLNQSYDIKNFKIVRFGICHSHVWEQLILPFFFIGRKNYIVINFTGLGSILVPHKIMTIHDLSFLVNPEWFSKWYYLYYMIMTPIAAKTSKAIITVSNFSKSEIIKYYKFINPDKIHVIYNAVALDKFSNDKRRQEPILEKESYILAVSSIDPRKNFHRLIEAFSEDTINCKLKIVGNSANKVFAYDGYAELNSCSNIQYLGRVSDAELSKLYARATAFIFPSLYEGFGIPPLEAMSEGCPVLVSDIPTTREVCNDAAIYFNPNDIISIRKAINNLLSNYSVLRPILVAKGKKNTERFSWTVSAIKLLSIIK